MSPGKRTAPGWRAVFQRLALAGVYFITAVAVVAGVLSKLNSRLLTQALIIFFGWPLVIRALTAIGALTVTGAVAAGKQIAQGLQDRRGQATIEAAAEAAMEKKLVPDVSAIPRWLARIYELLEARIALPDRSNSPRRQPQTSLMVPMRLS